MGRDRLDYAMLKSADFKENQNKHSPQKSIHKTVGQYQRDGVSNNGTFCG